MAISPTDISGLKLWLKADAITGLSNNDPVSTWEDSSVEGNDATNTASIPPVYQTNIVNGLPAINFGPDGNGDLLTLPDFASSFTAGTEFVVLKLLNEPGGSNAVGPPTHFGTHGDANHWPFSDGNIYEGFGSTARKNTGNPTADLEQFHIGSIISASSDWRFYINGSEHFSTTSNTVAFETAPRIGFAEATYFIRGHIAEIIIYDSALSELNQQQVEWYLADKYAISGPTDPDGGAGGGSGSFFSVGGLGGPFSAAIW